MKHIFKFFGFFIFSYVSAHDFIDYNMLVQPYAQVWKQECVENLTTQEIITLCDMLLLSYQVVQASCIMSLARLDIQSELFNIVTLSIYDSFEVRLQAQNNDFTKIKDSIKIIEQAQEKIKFACNTLKGFGPLVIHINPTPIQRFILHVKGAMLQWAKTQNKRLNELGDLHDNFLQSSDYFAHLKNVYQEIDATQIFEQNKLVDGANTLHALYNNVENMIAQFTTTRKQSTESFYHFLQAYFKAHYEILYTTLQNTSYSHQNTLEPFTYKFLATQDNQLPKPELFFA